MSFSETTLASFNYSGTYDGKAHGIALTNGCDALASISGATVAYATVEADVAADRYEAENPTFKNAGTNTVFYRIVAAGYAPYRGSATVEIKPRPLTEAMFSLLNVPTDGYVWDGTAKTPDYSCQDGSSSIIGPDDFTVAYSNNVEVGTATVTFTGKNNYTGAVKLHFKIVELYADVTFDALGGKIGAAGGVVTQTQTRVYNNTPANPTRENHTFEGWALGVTNNAPVAAEGAKWLAEGDHTLYARWAVDPAVLPGGVLAYTVKDDGTAAVTGLGTVAMRGTSLVIPDTIDGKFVTEIAAGAFASSTRGITSVTLPMFLEKVGSRAFYNVKTLETLTIPAVRNWRDPSVGGSLAIDGYAFSTTALRELRLPKEVTEIGSYAFMNCRSLASVTILGNPTVGTRPFRRAGIDAGSRPVIHLDPALAANTAYLSKLTNEFGDASLPPATRTDALVESVSPMGVSVGADGSVVLPVAVGRAAEWGAVDGSKVRVEYRENLTDAPTTLVPTVRSNAGGTLTLGVTPPGKSASGFFRVKVEK